MEDKVEDKVEDKNNCFSLETTLKLMIALNCAFTYLVDVKGYADQYHIHLQDLENDI